MQVNSVIPYQQTNQTYQYQEEQLSLSGLAQSLLSLRAVSLVCNAAGVVCIYSAGLAAMLSLQCFIFHPAP